MTIKHIIAFFASFLVASAYADSQKVMESTKNPHNRYTAVISCGMYGRHMNILACFEDTELKLTNEDRTGTYKIYNINQLGNEQSDGLHISLSEQFYLGAQNSHEALVLQISIYDESGALLLQESAGEWGVIRIEN